VPAASQGHGKHPAFAASGSALFSSEVGLIDLLLFSVGAAHGREKLYHAWSAGVSPASGPEARTPRMPILNE